MYLSKWLSSNNLQNIQVYSNESVNQIAPVTVHDLMCLFRFQKSFGAEATRLGRGKGNFLAHDTWFFSSQEEVKNVLIISFLDMF